MGLIYREIESVSRSGNLNQYWSLVRPVLVAVRSSIGRYYQPVLVGRATSTGSLAVLYRLLPTVGEIGGRKIFILDLTFTLKFGLKSIEIDKTRTNE